MPALPDADTVKQLGNRALQLARDRYFTPIDTLERHVVVAQLLGSPRTVVDVGGVPGQLGGALLDSAITALNVQPPADLLMDPGPLPFRDRTVEAVTSLDTLEHVPPEDRAAFVAELLRIDAWKLRPYGLTLSVSQTPDDWTAIVMKHSGSHQLCAAFEFQPEKRRVRPFRYLAQYPLRSRQHALTMAA